MVVGLQRHSKHPRVLSSFAQRGNSGQVPCTHEGVITDEQQEAFEDTVLALKKPLDISQLEALLVDPTLSPIRSISENSNHKMKTFSAWSVLPLY
ncbi:hypothetical protein BJX63DRAFT_415245 [Aspergillus granulosus]|uniref:Uncharacterized protein n=1 Tax=Aspergillus granulosus TaxID=176169 RepID=A0ABR4GTL1_9EURO